MSERLACMVTDFLLRKKVIEKKDSEIYYYGYDMLFSGVLQSLLLFVVGWAFGKLDVTIVFVAVFITLRGCTGGYHADTRMGCIVTTLFVYLFVLCACTKGTFLFKELVSIILLIVFYEISFIRYAPVEHKGKPLSKEQKNQNKKTGGVLSAIYSIIAVLLYNSMISISISIVMTMVCVAVLMIIQKGGRKCQD
ncbi:MAG: accessory gene regulator B family protein [Lachnospiraceae bacterium]|nr:accessory gene regulator B family protein [Lachnospiraceae bacterium]